MKEFIMKHPIVTFLLVDAVVVNILNFGNNILRYRAMCKGVYPADTVENDEESEETETEEETTDEPAGDNQ